MEEIKELERIQEPKARGAELKKLEEENKRYIGRIKAGPVTKELMQECNNFFIKAFGMGYKEYAQLEDRIRAKRLECVMLSYSIDIWQNVHAFN